MESYDGRSRIAEGGMMSSASAQPPFNLKEIDDFPIADLQFDPANPRLPVEMQGRGQDELLRYLADSFNAVEVGRSIAQFGYFASEPLIVIQDEGHTTVVEGNRRLAALKILKDPELAIGLQDESEWRRLADQATAIETVPVLIADSRSSVAPIIGYRHISGIQQWDSYAKARFIASLVDSGMSFDEVASIVGDTRTNVASHYRNHQIISQARDEFGINTRTAENDFGVFTHAMSQVALRQYISAPAPAQVVKGEYPLPPDRKSETDELFSWLFGKNKVITDSRQIRQLGQVLQSPEGVQVLRATRSLDEAQLSAGGPRTRLLTLLNRANNNLASAQSDFVAYADDEEVIQLIAQIRQRLEDMTAGERRA